jgi:hypothetical protein
LRGQGRFLGRELAVWLGFYGAYLAVRGVSIGDYQTAMGNARDVVAAERALGIFREDDVQSIASALHGVLSVYYMAMFAPLVAGVLLWVSIRDRAVYGELRTALLLAIGFASVFFVLYPVAPPRLVGELGLVDTVGLGGHDTGSFAGIPFNPYAAMPSMHVGWSLLIGIFGYRVARRRLTRAFFAAHPAVMALTVTATGNHYFADSIVGAAIALVALALARLVVARRARRADTAPDLEAGTAGRTGDEDDDVIVEHDERVWTGSLADAGGLHRRFLTRARRALREHRRTLAAPHDRRRHRQRPGTRRDADVDVRPAPSGGAVDPHDPHGPGRGRATDRHRGRVQPRRDLGRPQRAPDREGAAPVVRGPRRRPRGHEGRPHADVRRRVGPRREP